jgi:hypothetical protein
VTKATTSRPPCLFFASDGDHQIYSFSIDPSTGKLTATAQGSVPAATGMADPSDLLVVGRILIDSEPSDAAFRTFAINNDCSLTALMVNSTGAETDYDIAALHGPNIVSSDINSGNVVTYRLDTTTGALSEIHSVAGALSVPDSEAVQVKSTTSGTVINVFTGATLVPPEAQAAQTDLNGSFLNPFSGSPATDGDPSASNGVGVMVSGGLLLQLNNNSGSVGVVHHHPGHPRDPWLDRLGLRHRPDSRPYADGHLRRGAVRGHVDCGRPRRVPPGKLRGVRVRGGGEPVHKWGNLPGGRLGSDPVRELSRRALHRSTGTRQPPKRAAEYGPGPGARGPDMAQRRMRVGPPVVGLVDV